MTGSAQTKKPPIQRTKQSARAITFSILLDVETKSAYASDLLFSRLRDVDVREAALATELVMGALRWQRTLDFLIERYTKRSISGLDVEVLVALRMGIYQLRYLSRVPARAAVSESVELVRRARKSSAAPLVNAALRRAAEEKDLALSSFLAAKTDAVDALAIAHSHPTWMVERWMARFGEQKTVELLNWNNRSPNQACAILNAARRDEIVHSLEDAGIQAMPGRLLKDAVILCRGNIAKTRLFDEGWITVQDEASQIIPLLLDVKPGNSILDLSAAPGGKTLTLARNAGESGFVVACDINDARLRLMQERFKTAGLSNVSILALDGTRPLPFARAFDRILVDAPCSGTGTLQRNPEIRWRLRSEDLSELHARQVLLLTSALNYLAPDGKLIYSTCSMEQEENEAVIRETLAGNSGFRREPIKIKHELLACGVRAEDLTDTEGAFRTFSPEQHTDGFFAAMICRR